VRVQAGLLDKLTGKSGGAKKTVIITGASSGLGLATAVSLIDQETHYVICAVRNVQKMEEIAQELGWPKTAYKVLPLQLTSLADTKAFVQRFRKLGKTLDVLCCNAAVYLPNQSGPTWTEDGFEESLGVNHLSHFLLCNLMIPDLKKSKEPRCIIVGSITGNTNTVGGGAVKPFADLGELKGLARGLIDTDGEMRGSSMVDGAGFNGAKAYKDSKLANMMTVLELHRRYNESTGIVFTSMYPGCIAETALFRQKRTWFRKFFPIFMKYVTGGYVSEEEAGDRLAECINSPDTLKSGVYWSWNGGARTVGVYDPKQKTVVGAGGAGGELFENRPSGAVKDEKKGKQLWDYSMAAVQDFL
jgi:protochlorophyllide reductase